MLVAVETNAVAQAMGEEFVIGAIAGACNYSASRVVDRSGQTASTRGVECRILGLARKFIGFRDFLRRLAENSHTRDIGCIAVDAAAAINQHDIAFFESLRLLGAVR